MGWTVFKEISSTEPVLIVDSDGWGVIKVKHVEVYNVGDSKDTLILYQKKDNIEKILAKIPMPIGCSHTDTGEYLYELDGVGYSLYAKLENGATTVYLTITYDR